MSQQKTGKAPDMPFDELKKFDDRFVQLFPALETDPAKKFTAVLAVSEAVLNWYLVPVVEDTEKGAENCAMLIKRLINTVIGHINEIQRERIFFNFTREAIEGLKETTQPLKIFAERKEIEIFNQDAALVWRFSVFFEDEDENTDTLQIAAI